VPIQNDAVPVLTIATLGEIIEMALSDHVSFEQLRALHGLDPNAVKALMRQHLKRGSYLAWRKRVRMFSQQREFYKQTSIPSPEPRSYRKQPHLNKTKGSKPSTKTGQDS
jgi:uncharacterized protein (TIGR03643 family)